MREYHVPENQNAQQNFLAETEVETANPYGEILNLAKHFGVDSKFIDFDIMEIKTECKVVGESQPRQVPAEKLNIFDDDKFFVEKVESIKQNYLVKFYDTRQVKPTPLPNVAINANKNLTKILATVSQNADTVYFKEFDKKLINFIYKKLIKVGILVGIRNKTMLEEVAKIYSVLRVKEFIDKDYSFVVTAGVNVNPSADDALVFHYKNKNKSTDENDKIDYSNRGYLLGVTENELIFEYVKLREGANGRDVRGKLLPTQKAKATIAKMPEHTENIYSKEDEEGIKFFSKKSGYVQEEKGVFDIKDELDVNEISFKTTGSVDTGLDTNVTLNVKEKDLTKDAIGTGMTVEANEINIEGNVAANAVVKANKVVIGGQTHAKALIEAKDAKIAVHIGSFDGEYVEIDRLEGGKVKAKKVVIKSAIGGEIIAESVIIDTLVSNSNIIIADTLEIKKLKGVNNKILVDFSMIKNTGEQINERMAKIKTIREQIVKMPRTLESKRCVIEENKGPINVIKAKIEELKSTNNTPPVTFMKKLKEYQQLVHEYNALLKEFREKKAAIAELKSEIANIQDGIFSSKVINHSNWREFNEIKFRLVDPARDITYSTRENEIARVITIAKVETEDGDIDYVVKKNNNVRKA
ncbi:flagellar assembly protein A [Campylobacter showae]|uniref:flagellar assembly protein A n=1 Tax=Campylobacter showae TaxID=204 RepID=UPI001F146F1C|nr:flagellar assembly protein A [Campylobacter showae]